MSANNRQTSPEFMRSNNPAPTAAIGIFDSGIGGLSVARQIKTLLPNEHQIYIADNAFAPYGCKPTETIEARSLAISQLLAEKQVKALVVACNTATVSAIQSIRSQFNIPVIGIEPGIKPATEQHAGKVALLTTAQTSQSTQLASLLERFDNNQQVIVQPCPGLVEQIESLKFASNQTKQLLNQLLVPLKAQGVTTIILGCTHYPFVTEQIRQAFDQPINIIDTGAAVAREVARRLGQINLLNPEPESQPDEFYATGETHGLKQILAEIWPNEYQVSHCISHQPYN